MKNSPVNIPASVHQRLLNHANETGRSLNEWLYLYAAERFLYRLASSPYHEKLILKGAMVFIARKAPRTRPTLDIDFLGFTKNTPENLEKIIRAICCISPAEDDGMRFDTETVRAIYIKKNAEYQGVRISFMGFLGKIRIRMQIDVGFDDIVFPAPEKIIFPAILNYTAPEIMAYTLESMVAEKFEAMVKLGLLNSRMKDFFDIWLVSRQWSFQMKTLTKAILATFEKRGTVLTATPAIFTASIDSMHDKQIQWKAFVRKSKLGFAPQDFNEVTKIISSFIAPAVNAILNDCDVNKEWVQRVGADKSGYWEVLK